MKSQARLRLRGIGKHHGDTRPWIIRLSMIVPDYRKNLAHAYERNCAPKHSDQPNQLPYVTMNYVTGAFEWHGHITFSPSMVTGILQPHGFIDMTVRDGATLETVSETR